LTAPKIVMMREIVRAFSGRNQPWNAMTPNSGLRCALYRIDCPFLTI
jgi:hypothetical protein